jgi:hypothetical protein
VREAKREGRRGGSKAAVFFVFLEHTAFQRGSTVWPLSLWIHSGQPVDFGVPVAGVDFGPRSFQLPAETGSSEEPWSSVITGFFCFASHPRGQQFAENSLAFRAWAATLRRFSGGRACERGKCSGRRKQAVTERVPRIFVFSLSRF